MKSERTRHNEFFPEIHSNASDILGHSLHDIIIKTEQSDQSNVTVSIRMSTEKNTMFVLVNNCTVQTFYDNFL